jgi:BMFP domain-containing protein YqiC
MQTRNPILDDLARVMSGAAGMAQAAGDEVKAVARAQGERFVAEMDLARRDEVDALKALARSALEKVEALEARVAVLEGQIASKRPGDTA